MHKHEQYNVGYNKIFAHTRKVVNIDCDSQSNHCIIHKIGLRINCIVLTIDSRSIKSFMSNIVMTEVATGFQCNKSLQQLKIQYLLTIVLLTFTLLHLCFFIFINYLIMAHRISRLIFCCHPQFRILFFITNTSQFFRSLITHCYI